MNNSDIIIRKFKNEDRKAVKEICLETSFLEEPRGFFLDDDEILSNLLYLYYTDYVPESCFVAVHDGKVIGYLIGSKNVKSMDIKFNLKVFPCIILRIIYRGLLFRKHFLIFIFNVFKGFFNGDFSFPDFCADYPATFHVNIDAGYRGLGVGSRLIENYLNYLKENKTKGLHFGTMSEEAKEFFLKSGFRLLFETETIYLRYYFKRKLPYYIFGKKL